MASRLWLQSTLEALLGSKEVYFQPPASVRMTYPAIVYNRSNIKNTNANNGIYKQDIAYQVIVIDRNPDSDIVYSVSRLPSCRYDRHYVADNLNHDVFTIYI